MTGKLGKRALVLLGIGFVALGLSGLALGAKSSKDQSLDAKIAATQTSQSTRVLVDSHCGKGKRAVGGGILPIGSASGVNTKASGPIGNPGDKAKGWSGDVSSEIAKTYKVFAICSEDSDATIHTVSFTDDGDTASATVNCAGSSRALSGGMLYDDDQTGDTGVLRIEANGPVDSSGDPAKTKDGDTAKKWYVEVDNPTGPHLDLHAYAICSHASHAKLETTTFSVDGTTGSAEHDGSVAACEHGERALGGGVLPVGGADFGLTASGPRNDSFTVSGTKSGDVASQWYGSYTNYSSEPQTLKVMAICG